MMERKMVWNRSSTALMLNVWQVKITLQVRFMKIGVWFQSTMMTADFPVEI